MLLSTNTGYDPYNSVDSQRDSRELRNEAAANKALVESGMTHGLPFGLPGLLRKQVSDKR